MRDTVVIAGRVPVEVKADLERIAKEKATTASVLVGRAVAQALKRWEKK